MLKLLWNALKVSPAILGASLLVASSAYAAIEPTTQPSSAQTETALPNELTASQETIDQVSALPPQGSVQNPVENASVNLTPSQDASPSLNQTPILAQQMPSADFPAANPSSEVLDQINRYSREGNSNNSLNQVTNVNQLRDVSPGDWAYEALRSLVERYGCIVGYPDGTYRGNRATTRFEFAAGLNACLNQIERLIAASTEGFVRREDLETLQRLVQEFQAELATLGTRVDTLEGRVAFLEENQFSTTTRLNGEAYFVLADTFGNIPAVPSGFARPVNVDDDTNTVFANRVRLNFDTSFTGNDRLRTRLQARNFNGFTEQTNTAMTEFGVEGGGNNEVVLQELSYQFGFRDTARVYIGTTGLDLDDIALAVIGTPNAPSDFGSLQPIYKLASGAGAGVTLGGGNSPLRIDLGYIANNADNPGPDNGVFNGSYAAIGQVTFQAGNALQIAGTYVHGYDVSPGGGDGSVYANSPFGGNPFAVTADGDPSVFNSDNVGFVPSRNSVNAYQVSALFRLGTAISIGGWVGYANAIDEVDRGAGRRSVWNYAGTLTFNDFGSPGSELGFIFGMPPRNRTGPVGVRRDLDTSFHAEAYYKLQLNDNIAIIPGAFVLFNPEHNNANDDIFVGTIQTLFTF